MRKTHVVASASLLVFAAMLSFGVVDAAPPPGSGDMVTFYGGPVGRTGQFRGKLLCLCCDLMPEMAKAKKCDKDGHHQAVLSIDEGSLHPLIAGTAEVTEQIHSEGFYGKTVAVSGIYYPSTGMILVSKIEAL